MSGDSHGTVLVLICGPPASGKTTLAVKLKEKLNGCLLLSFDEIFSPEEQEAAVKAKGHLKILRRTMLEGVENILDGHIQTEAAEKVLKGQRVLTGGDLPNGKWQFVLIDDNLYLSSMRYCWFQAVRARGLSLCSICVTSSLEECLARNRQRSSPVLESVVVDQFHKMEPPISGGHEAEKFSIVVNTSGPSSYSTLIEQSLAIISSARCFPFLPRDSKALEERAESSRRETRSSKLHNLDLAFRKAVTSLLSNESRGSAKQELWNRANSLKDEVLAEPSLETLSSQLQTSAGKQRNDIEGELQNIIIQFLSERLSLQQSGSGPP